MFNSFRLESNYCFFLVFKIYIRTLTFLLIDAFMKWCNCHSTDANKMKQSNQSIVDGNEVSHLILIFHCDKICNIFFCQRQQFDKKRNKCQLDRSFTIRGLQIKIQLKSKSNLITSKTKHFKALILLNVNTLSNISTKCSNRRYKKPVNFANV